MIDHSSSGTAIINTVIGTGKMTCQVIEGYLICDLLFTAHTTQRCLDDSQSIVGDQRNAESEQRCLGVTQCVNCGMEVRLQFLECGLYGPALAVQFSSLFGRSRRFGQVRQQGQYLVTIARGLF